MRFTRFAAGVGLAMIIGAGAVRAQDDPATSIRLVSPFAAGSVAEVFFRILAVAVEPKLGQRFVVEGKPGADGNIGAAEVARAKPDGYTLLLAPTATFAVVAHLYKELPFDPLNGFEHISMLVENWPLATVGAGVPARSLGELAEYVRANPGKFNYGSQGSGTPTHLIGAAFSRVAGNTLMHIPYKGTPQMMQAMLAGDIQLVFASTAAVLPQLKAGKLRALAVMGRQRQAELPELPTTVEAGFPQLAMSNWWILAAPKGTNSRIVDRLAVEFRAALADAGARKRIMDLGLDPVGLAPAETAAYIRSESARYKTIIEQGNIRLE